MFTTRIFTSYECLKCCYIFTIKEIEKVNKFLNIYDLLYNRTLIYHIRDSYSISEPSGKHRTYKKKGYFICKLQRMAASWSVQS